MQNKTICSIDPAFKKCGVVVLSSGDLRVQFAENVDFLKDYKKSNQTDYILTIWQNMTALIERIQTDYKPDIWVIEAQIGQFACIQVQTMLICAISKWSKDIVSQSPKSKLLVQLGLIDYVDSDSNKYNQNKNRAKAYAAYFLKESAQTGIDLDRDISDALLHAIYYATKHLGTKIDYSQYQKLQQPNDEKKDIKPAKPRKAKAK